MYSVKKYSRDLHYYYDAAHYIQSDTVERPVCVGSVKVLPNLRKLVVPIQRNDRRKHFFR